VDGCGIEVKNIGGGRSQKAGVKSAFELNEKHKNRSRGTVTAS
jgi:hypothetical protein